MVHRVGREACLYVLSQTRVGLPVLVVITGREQQRREVDYGMLW